MMRSEVAKSGRPQVLRDTAVVTLVTVACLIPFLKKPFHIDDPLFVWTAQHITTSPQDFYGFAVNWALTEGPMHDCTQNPPLACYWLALVGSIGGWSEISLHLGMLPVALAATVGTYSAARLLCKQPLFATLIAFFTPAFLVSATSLMCDVMMLALWCWAVYFWLLAYRRERVAFLFVAGLLVALAALTKYYAIALIPLLLAYSMRAQPRRFIGWSVLAMLAPLAVMGGYEFLTGRLYGHGLLSSAFRFSEVVRELNADPQEGLVQKLLNLVIYTGGCVLPFVFFAPFLGKPKWLSRVVVFIVGFNVVAWVMLNPDPPPESLTSYYLHVFLFSAAGSVLLALTAGEFYESRTNPDALLLALWIGGTVVFAIFLNWTTNARSILPLAPAAGIVAARRLEIVGGLRTFRLSGWLALPLATAASVSLLVAWADFAHASAERDAARQLARLAHESGRQIWYSSHWGFQYYLQQASFYPVDMRSCVLEKGDLYAQPGIVVTFQLPPEVMEPHARLRFPAAPLGSTMSPSAGAGFYSTVVGPLPFSLAPDNDIQYFVFSFPKQVTLGSGEQR